MGALSESRVFLFGASAVGIWVAKFATELGFPVTVLDNDTSKFAPFAEFQNCTCQEVDFTALPAPEELGITERDLLCVITRGHTYDPQSFVYAMQTPALYVGMMGKPAKNAKCVAYALEQGCTQAQIDRCAFPIGVEIGAIDAPEIGLSVVAQLVAVHNAAFPREKDHDSIHAE